MPTRDQYRFLGKDEIRRLIEERSLRVEPLLTDKQITAVGIDLRLDSRFRRFREYIHGMLDITEEVFEEEVYEFIETKISRKAIKEENKEKIYLNIEPLILQPKEFIIAQTFEYVVLPNNLIGFLDGRSSLARRGLMIHATAGSIEPGFHGRITLELGNIGKIPLKIYPLTRIANLHLAMISNLEEGYRGQFNFQVRMRPPKPDEDLLRLLGKDLR
jgi:dCTP deaminase